MTTPTVFWTIAEAAEELRLSRSLLYGMARRGEIPGVAHVGRAVRLHRETVVLWATGQADAADGGANWPAIVESGGKG